MVIIVPFFPTLTDYDKWATVLKRQGQSDNHNLVVVTQRPHEEKAIAFKDSVATLFRKADVRVIDLVEQGGGIGVSNKLFKAAVYTFEESRPAPGEPGDLPMIYMDPTWRVTKIGWADGIQAEFYTQGRPRALGTGVRNAAGELVTRGPLVLSRQYVEDTALLPHIPANTHWRDYLRYEIGNVLVLSQTIGADKGALVKPPAQK